MADEGLDVLGWRDVPTDPSSLGRFATDPMPVFRMLFIASPASAALARGAQPAPDAEHLDRMDLERRVYVARKRTEHEIDPAPVLRFAVVSHARLQGGC